MATNANEFENNLTREWGRALTRVIAEEELPFYDDLVDAPISTNSQREHTLGFGIPDAEVATVSLVLFSIGRVVVQFLWDNGKDVAGQLIKDASDELRLSAVKKLKQWLELRFATKAPITVEVGKVTELLDVTRQEGQRLGLNPSQIDRLSDVLKSAFST